MIVKVVNKSKHPLPKYSTDLSAGLDLRANINEPIELAAFERRLIPTGLYIQLKPGYEAQIRPRSGLALKKGLTILNTPGTIDADYRGEVGIIIVNLSNSVAIIEDGERICQMVISKHEQILWEEVNNLETSERGDGGFGHTGNK